MNTAAAPTVPAPAVSSTVEAGAEHAGGGAPPVQHEDHRGQTLEERMGATTPKRKKGQERRDVAQERVDVDQALRIDYLQGTDTTHVTLSGGVVCDLARVILSRKRVIDDLRNRGKTIRDPLEDLVSYSSGKWEKWLEYFEKIQQGQTASTPTEKLSRVDLDVAYYLVFDEVTQLGVVLGSQVVFDKGGFLKAGGLKVKPGEPSYLKHAGLFATEYMRERYGHLQTEEQLNSQLLSLDKLRLALIEEISGRKHPDMDFNWGSCMDSIFTRGRAGLKFHDEILKQLEANVTYRALLQRYTQRTGRQIQTVTDLLVTIDNPEDRVEAIKIFHEATIAAAAQRFEMEGKAFVGKYFEERKEQWQHLDLIEGAKARRDLLQAEEERRVKPEGEAKEEFEELQKEMQQVRECLQGKPAQEGGQAVPSLPEKAQKLYEAVFDYREETNVAVNPQNDLAQIRIDLNNARQIYDTYRQGHFPGGVVPPDLQGISGQIVHVTQELLNIRGAAGITEEVRQAHIQAYQAQLTTLNQQYADRMKEYRDLAEREFQRLTAEENRINTSLQAKRQAIRDAYRFMETELPNYLAQVTAFRTRLDHLIHPPAPPGGGAAPAVAEHIQPHIAEINQQTVHLTGVIDYINNLLVGQAGPPPITGLRMNVGQAIGDYVAHYNLQLNIVQFQGVANPLEEDVRRYSEILAGRTQGSQEAKTRRIGNDLVLALVEGIELGQPKKALLDKAIAGTFAQMQEPTRDILTQLYNQHDLHIIRRILLDHPEIMKNEDLRDQVLWQRVFSDVFILQAALEFYRDIELPSAPAGGGVGIDLENAADSFRNRIIERMAGSHAELGRFLVYLVEKRLDDAATTIPVNVNIRQAISGAAPGAPIAYDDVPDRHGHAIGIFSIEENNSFITRMRDESRLWVRTLSRGVKIENVGSVHEIIDKSFTVPRDRLVRAARGIRVEANEQDSYVFETVGRRRREMPIKVEIRTVAGRPHVVVLAQAHPSLADIGPVAAQFGNTMDRRWANLLPMTEERVLGRRFHDYTEFINILRDLTGLAGVVDINNHPVHEGLGKWVLRSLGNWYLGHGALQRRRILPRFGDVEIQAGVGYDNLQVAGYIRLSMDASGNLELQRADGTRISVDSALATSGPQPPPLGNEETEQLFRLIGSQVFATVGV